MLTKDLTPNPKAVNIIRPSHTNYQFISHQQTTNFNYSYSTDSSSCTFSTTASGNTHTISPMIRQPSVESNPGLSFFCQPSSPNNNIVIKNNNTQKHHQQQQHASFEKIQAQPLVISRINLTQRRPTVVTDLEDIDHDDDEGITTPLTEQGTALKSNTTTTTTTEDSSSTNMVRLPSFTPGFGIMSGGGAGLGSFMLRGNITQQVKPQVDEARVNRKIEDLEIEKKSLLTLNKTLETVVKEQSNTISDLQDRLAAIERPLTPGLDTSLSKNGIMSSADILESSDLERYLEDEDAAFERIKIMLLDLIEQAQSAVSQNKKVPGRVISDYDVNRNGMKRSEAFYNGRPRSVAGDRSSTSTRNLAINNQQSNRSATRRISLGSINSAASSALNSSNGRLSSSPTSTKQLSSSPTTSPIPNRRYSIQRSVSRSSSPAVLTNSSSNSSMHSATSTTSRASKYNIKHKPISHQQDSQTRKWLN